MLALVNTPNGQNAANNNTANNPAPVALRDVPEPSPAANEVVVAVRAFSLNRGELRLMQTRPEGWRPGQDISGVVLRAAADGTGPAAGTRVVALTDNAGWAQCAAAPVHRLAALPDNVSFEQAAALPIAGLTALRTLRHGAPLLGKRVLVTGAAGGVGHLAVQIAARSGAQLTAVVGSPERGRHLRGVAAIVDDVAKAEGRFGLILESAGGSSLAAAIARIAPKGTIVIFGNSSGDPTPVSFRDFAEHANARIQSFSYFTSEPEDRFAPDLALLVSLVADGSLKPALVESSWRDLARIGPQLRDRHIAGKAVFRVEQG
jgi:NADPH:quinone reductase-like Zn-dependent oxidoreductase